MFQKMRLSMCLVFVMLLLPAQALAAKSTFVVLPFTVNGPSNFTYLERSVPQMLTSRLYAKGEVEAATEVPASQGAVSDAAAADRVRNALKADYVVFGTITIMGDAYSLDVRVRDRAGKSWNQASDGKISQLIAGISKTSDAINRQVFGRGGAGSQVQRTNQMHPDIVVNQDRPKDVYLNPQFRYSGSSTEDESRLRSQALQFTAIGMEVADIDRDGRNEIILLSETALYAYRFEGSRLNKIAEFELPRTMKNLTVRVLPGASKDYIIVNMMDKDVTPQASIFTWSGNGFVEEYKRQKYFLNVVQLAPNYQPTLIGQKSGRPRLFASGVHEILLGGNGELVQGTRLNLPEDADVFNFTYLPGGLSKEGDKLVVLNRREKLRTYTLNGSRLAETDEKYSGAAVGVETNPSMPGLARDEATMGEMYFIPMRMVPMDIEQDGNYELLVNRPISTASGIFDRYRFNPQSEIHSLFWDGIGLNLQWKTRRIKGSTVDYTIADANNDGVTDLVVCLNTHPGALGVNARKAVVLIYPLDVSQADPNTTPYEGN